MLLSQLAGEPPPTLLSVPRRIVKSAWPSFLVVLLLIIVVGALVHPSFESPGEEQEAPGWWVGIYYSWCCVFRSPCEWIRCDAMRYG